MCRRFIFKMLLKETGSQGVIASLLSLVTSNTNSAPVFWDIKVWSDCYHSYSAFSLSGDAQILVAATTAKETLKMKEN